MNRTLALYFADDYLIAGVEPLINKFYPITKRGLNEFPFYFFIDTINHKIDYSFLYKNEADNQKTNYIGDFLTRIKDKSQTYRWYDYENELVNLLLIILNDIKDSYFSILRSIGSANDIDEKEIIPTVLAFSDDIDAKTQKILCDFLGKHSFEIKEKDKTFAELVVNQFIIKKNYPTDNKKFAVIEALGYNLNMSVVGVYNKFDRERSQFKSFNDFGQDPRIQVITKKIVDDINKQEGILKNEQAKRKEYIRHTKKAEEIIEKIETSSIPYIEIETNFLNAGNRKLRTIISVDEIEQLTSFHVQQISRFFENHFVNANNYQIEDFEKLFLVGNTLNNELVRREFNRFGQDKIIYIPNNELSTILIAMLFPERKVTTKSNAGIATDSNIYQTVDFLTVSKLAVGQKVKLSNNNSDPAKGSVGASVQELKYTGNNKFLVVKSTRSLTPGDIAKAITPVWVSGIQADFDIERKGKLLGRFRTRTIVKIDVC